MYDSPLLLSILAVEVVVVRILCSTKNIRVTDECLVCTLSDLFEGLPEREGLNHAKSSANVLQCFTCK